METRFATGIQKAEDGYSAGKAAASQAKEKLGADRVDLCVVFSSSKYNYSDVIKGVREVSGNAELVGCSTAGEFTEEAVETGSVGVALISSDNYKFVTGMGKGLKEDEIKCMEEASASFPKSIDGFLNFAALNFHDGLAGKGEEIALSTVAVLGKNYSVAGGSAGDDLKMKETFVFQNDNVASNAVSLAMIASKSPVSIAVRHGHCSISDPMKVTRSENNIVQEIDGKPAFEMWKEAIRTTAKDDLDIDVDEVQSGSKELSQLLTRYELGIDTGEGYKVRWPGLTTATDGPMTFACAMPEGSVFRVMGSPKEAQLDAAKEAVKAAVAASGGVELAGALVIECVVHAIILGDDLKKSVQAIYEELKAPLLGFESYGELALQKGQMSGYHNTTTVIMLFPK